MGGDQTSSKQVPKFTSFRPKPPSSTVGDGTQTEPPLEQGAVEGHKPARTGRHGSFKPSHPQGLRQSLTDTRRDSSVSSTFTLDTAGDKSNVTYGSLHKYSIPKYRRSGHGSILGLPHGDRIDFKHSTENTVTTVSSNDRHAARSRKALWSVIATSQDQYVSPNERNGHESDVVANYIPLKSKESRRRRRADSDQSDETDSSFDDANMHSPVTGIGLPSNSRTQGLPQELASISNTPGRFSQLDEDQEPKTHEHTFLDLGATLADRVKRDDTSGQAWIDLIEYQGQKFSQHADSLTGDLQEDETISMADLKMSIAQKALKTVNNSRYQQSLLRIYMREGIKVWDSTRAASSWRDILSRHPQHLLLKVDYLNFLLTHSRNFNVHETKEAFITVLEALNDASPLDSTNPGALKSYVLLRSTVFLSEAGYDELANAIWQANIEFNLCRPARSILQASNATSYKALLELFDIFWESEGPRVGEIKSTGWASHVVNQSIAPTTLKDPPLPCNAELRLPQWPEEERMASTQMSMPARTLDDVGENDPYRVILFSDVRPFLIDFETLPDTYSSLLVVAFLAFCGLPPPPGTTEERQWWLDPFVRNPSLNVSQPTLTEELERDLHSSCPFAIIDPTSSFTNMDHWFSMFGQIRQPQLLTWISTVLQQIDDIGGYGLTEYRLSFEHHTNTTTSKKLARSLIKRRPTNLLLYRIYAAIEASNGNIASAETTLSTVSNMNQRHEDLAIILLSRVWYFLEKSSFHDALEVFYEHAQQDSKSSADAPHKAAVMRVQNMLTDTCIHLLALADVERACYYIELHMLFQYLLTDDLKAALASFTNSLRLLPAGTESLQERLHQSRARLMYMHMVSKAMFSPSSIRSALEESISLFPNNTMFLCLFAHLERRFRIEDRIRSTVRSLLKSSDGIKSQQSSSGSEGSVIPHYFAIDTELRRSVEVGGGIHATRSTFERAVHSEDGRRNAGLWKRYFLFECEQGEKKRARAIFYRAIAVCPWVKELYLLAFERLQDMMSLKELKGVYETMVDRDIRIRIPLDDLFEMVAQGND